MDHLIHERWEGTEKKVDRTDIGHVTAEYKFVVPPNLLKGAYYLNNILELLLPGQIPHMHSAWASKYVADYIPHDERHNMIQEEVKQDKPSLAETQAEADERIKKLNQQLISLGIYSDNKSGRNYIIDTNGTAEYVDAILPWQIIQVYNKNAINQTTYRLELNTDFDKLTEKIESLPEILKARAEPLLERLKTLWGEERKKPDLFEYLHVAHDTKKNS